MDNRSNRLSLVILVAVAAGAFALAHLMWLSGTPPLGAPSNRLKFLRTPVELIGLLLFLAMGTVEVAAASRDEAGRARLRCHVLAIAILGVGLMFWVSMNTNRLPLPQYLVAGAAATWVLVACAMFVPFRLADVLRGVGRDVRYVMSRRSSLLGLMAAGLILIARPAATAPAAPTPPSETVAWFESQPRMTAGAPWKPGSVTILEFTDYQCPACRRAATYYAGFFEGLARKYPGRIEHRVLDFPLDGECSPVDVRHPAACEAAVAVRLARAAGRQDRMVSWLWAAQERLTPATVATAVEQVVGLRDFAERYDTALAQVKLDIAIGVKAGVTGTPSFLVNGVLLTLTPKRHFEAIIDAEMNRR